MPLYGSAPSELQPGDLIALFNADTGPAKSMSVSVQAAPNSASQPQYSVNLHFASAPTSFTFNMQGANDDVEAEYINITSGNIATGTATDYRIDFTTNASFLRANLSAQTGGGLVTVKIFRAA